MMIEEARKEQIQKRIVEFSTQELNDKDVDVLVQIYNSEPMLKALGKCFAVSQALPSLMMSLDLGDPVQVATASRVQGRVQGVTETIDYLLQMVTLPQEDEEDGSSDSES
jgi:hypothetical protein